jgi:hypothetical protein
MDVTELDTLSTEDLRAKALAKAQEQHDVAFVWDLAKHLGPMSTAATEDGSSGAITGTIAEAVETVLELSGRHGFGDAEPLIRARLIDYLSEPEGQAS